MAAGPERFTTTSRSSAVDPLRLTSTVAGLPPASAASASVAVTVIADAAGGVARGVAEVLDSECRVRDAVQYPGHTAGHAGQDREVLKVVSACVAVAEIVRGRPVAVEVDAERAVVADRIAEDRIVAAARADF